MYNEASSPIVTNSLFVGNGAVPLDASDGGGMFNINASPVIDNCTFTENIADHGGGIFNKDSSPVITNSKIIDNLAWDDDWGGGILAGARYGEIEIPNPT